MVMLNLIGILMQSDKRSEQAAQNTINEATSSARRIRSIYVKAVEATVEHAKIAKYRIKAALSFCLEGSRRPVRS